MIRRVSTEPWISRQAGESPFAAGSVAGRARPYYCGNMRATERASRPERIAILPLRNSVLFPMSVVPINVGRPRSVRLVEDLVGNERALVGVLTQKNAETVEPTFDDLYAVGTDRKSVV